MRKNKQKPSVLFIAPVCFPPAQPEAIVNAKLALAMKEAGWHVDVITESLPGYQWYPFHREAWLPLVEDVHIVPAMARTLKNLLYCSLRSSAVAGNVFWAAPAFDCIKQLLRTTKYDVILSRSIPAAAHLPAMMTHNMTGLPWIANWNDPQPWHKFPPPYGEGLQSKMHLRESIYYNRIAKLCSWHTFPSERLRQYMASYLPDILPRTSVIPHIALDSNNYHPPVHHNEFSLCYAGSLRPPRDPEVLLEGVRRFVRRLNDLNSFDLRFIVDLSDKAVELAKEKGLEKFVRIEPAQPYEKMPDVLATADVLVIIEAPVSEGIFLPSKFVDYVQAGRPILALSPIVGTLNDILSALGGGLAVDGGAPDAVAEALWLLYSHWLKGTLHERYGSLRLLPLFSQENILDQYLMLIERLSFSHN